jgi:hypothetical protein
MELFYLKLKNSTYNLKELEEFKLNHWESLLKIENDIK